MKTIIMIVLGVIVLIGGTGAATYFLLVDNSSEQNVAETEGDGQSEGGKEAQDAKKNIPKVYHTLHPNFIVNFQNPNRARFLQVSVEVMAHSDEVIELVEQHTPVIRNNLLMLFSSQDSQLLSTRDGKETLRQEVLKEIQNILKQQSGEPGVEQAYFTSFVMQ